MAKGSAIPEALIEEVKSRANIADFASEVVQLKRVGRSLVGLCPFHQEKTPSFHVHDEEGYFNCFGCGKKGSLFTFIMETKGLTFPEAVRFVATRIGVEIPRESDHASGERAQHEQHSKLRAVTRAAAEVFQLELANSSRANAYLDSRGVSQETRVQYSLGFAPRAWEFILPAVKKQLGAHLVGADEIESLLLTVGLLKKRGGEGERGDEDQRGCYDSFRERLIFPIARSDGSPIAFGGRLLAADPKAPKYINSPESPLYAKRKTLYGLPQALPALRREKRAFLVEGYMDVLSMVQGGFPGTVACCGTALTPEHAKILARFVERTTVVFDGDMAGRAAASKSVEAFLNTGVDLFVATLPQDEDPDSLVRSGEVGRLREALEHTAIAGLEFVLKHFIEEEGTGGQLSPAILGKVAQRFALLVAKIQNPVEKEFSLRRGADVLGVSVDSLDRIVRDESKRAQSRWAAVGEVTKRSVPSHSPVANEGVMSVKSEPVFVPAHTDARPSRTGRNGSVGLREGDGAARHFLFRQMVVALLCEPSLATSILALAEADAERPPLPKKLRRFIEEVIQIESFPSIEIVVKGGDEGAATARLLEEILAKHGLGGGGLVEEAVKQCQVGGSDPKRLLDDSGRATHWTSVKEQVEVLHRRAVATADQDDKARLIQEKLLKRRTLERFRPER